MTTTTWLNAAAAEKAAAVWVLVVVLDAATARKAAAAWV
jgi:hypothetical protein